MEKKSEDIKKRYMDDLYHFQLSTKQEKREATEDWCRAKLAKDNPNPEAVENDNQKPELET